MASSWIFPAIPFNKISFNADRPSALITIVNIEHLRSDCIIVTCDKLIFRLLKISNKNILNLKNLFFKINISKFIHIGLSKLKKQGCKSTCCTLI